MNLAPLANVVAYLDRNPAGLARVKEALNGRFDVVWSPGERCVMATRALPRSVPDGEDLRAAGVAFAEGRDAVPGEHLTTLALKSLPGNAGFVRAEGDHLVVVRSGPGTVPWYAWGDAERALVTTSFSELVRLLPVTPELDPLVCGMWAGSNSTFPDGRTFLRGVVAIHSGHTAEITPGRPVRPRSWWSPWPEELPWPTRDQRAENVHRFGEAVLTALDREIADQSVNLLTLSGGVDSSVLAYLVGRRLDRPLAALSFVPPVGAAEAQREASYLDPIVAELGIAPHVRQPLGAADFLALVAGTPPVAFPVLHPALQALPSVVREHSFDILVGGEFADEICGGWFALPDWLDNVSLPRLASQLGSLPRSRSDLVAWARRRIPHRAASGPWPTSLPNWVQPEIDEEYQVWRTAQNTELRASPAPHRYQRAVLSWLDGALAMNWEVCSSLQVRRAFPFLTAELLTVISACHPAELLGPGPKRLERQAFAGVVPERYLHRPDKGGWGGADIVMPAPPVPACLGSVFRGELGPVTSLQATTMQILSRFTVELAAARAGVT